MNLFIHRQHASLFVRPNKCSLTRHLMRRLEIGLSGRPPHFFSQPYRSVAWR